MAKRLDKTVEEVCNKMQGGGISMKINIDFPIETEFYEFKTSLAELDKGIETIAAMLNKHGQADVFYGVSNDGEAIGLKGQIGAETIKKVEQRIGEILKPSIVPSIITHILNLS